MKVIRRDFGQGSVAQEQGILIDGGIIFDRSIYREIGSLTDNKSITLPTGPDSPFDRWLIAMNEYYDTGVASPELIAIDEYLGRLYEREVTLEDGSTTLVYPFDTDGYWVKEWIDITGAKVGTRNVVHGLDNVVHLGDNVVHTG